MSIRKLSQIFLSFAFASATLLTSTASGQSAPEQPLPFVPSRVTERVDDTQRVTLRGNTHPMARAAFDRGLVEASLPMERMMLALKRSPEQEAALAAFDERQLDPASPDYHHWLTAEEFGRTYGPSDADIATVTGWLERHGFQIYEVSKGRVFIQFSGTAAQVQEAFHVEMHNYLVNGKAHIANDRDPEIPEALSPVITGIASLHDFFPVHQSVLGRYVTRDPITGKVTPVASSDAPLSTSGGLHPNFVFTDPNSDVQSEDIAPYDFAAIYNLTPLWTAGYTGKNLSVAISAVTDLNLTDITTFRQSFGLSSFAGTVKQVINGTDPGIVSGAQVENTLDTEWSGATAPDAQILVVISKTTATTFGGDLSNAYIIDNSLAPIMSASYGDCEIGLGTAGNSAANSLYQQGSTEGLSLFESSGDQGSTGCDNSDATTFPAPAGYGLQVNGLASSPYITGVGGTDFNWQTVAYSKYWNATNSTITHSNAIGYIPEIPWNGTCTSTFLLDSVFTGQASSEALCNAAVGGGDADLVKVTGGSGGVSSCITSTGGEFSSCGGGYAKPTWQKGTGVPADGVRDVPDVSLFASSGYPDGIPGSAYLICVSSSSPAKSCDYSGSDIVYQEVGGTSVSSPAMAGIMALILQKVGGKNLGLVNPVLYQLAATENLTNCNASTAINGNTCIFYDVTTGTNAMVCTKGSINCVTNTSGDSYGIVSGYNSTTGYDLVTGLGSVNVNNLAKAWPATAAATLTFTPTSLTFASTTVGTTTAAQSVTVKNTGTASATLTTIAITGSTDFAITAKTCTGTLAAGASCTVSVDFKPAAAGSATGAISFTDSATGSPQTVALAGTGAAAALTVTVTPGPLTFASTTVGSTTAAQVVTVKNTSVSAVTLGTIGFTGTNATSFLKSATTCTTSLAAAASCTISVEFKPTVAGALTASLSIADNATGTPQLVVLKGTAVAAPLTVTISATTLTFASATVGTTTAAQVVTVKNTSVSAVTLGTIGFTGTNATSFLKSATTCTTSLAAAASCTISVEFKPTVAGALTASLSIADNATGSPQLVALKGTAVAAPLTVTISATTLAFASTTVGSTTAAQVVTVKNTSVSAVTLGTIGFTGTNATSFLKSATTCTTSLAAAASCTISVEFKPTVAGALTASLSIADNATGTPQLVKLTGTGVAATLPVLTLSVTSIAFPNTAVGSTSDLQTVTLSNTSTISATISAIALSGTNATSFLHLSSCGATLAANASCSIYVSFKPTAAGALTGNLSITDNATGSPQKVTLTGTGTVVPALKLNATTLAFGTEKVGSTAALKTLTLTNSGTAVVELDSITLAGTNPTSFLELNTCGATLAAGANCTVYVGFTPTVTGALTGMLSIVSSGSGSPQAVALTGTGD